MSDDPSHILFPSDAPSKPAAAPEWFSANISAAEQRLSGRAADASPAGKPGVDASLIFKNEGPKAPVDTTGKTVEDALFPDDAAKAAEFDPSVVSGFLDAYTISAIENGDTARAGALKHATAALADDFRQAGTSTETLQEAFDIVRSSNDRIHPITPEDAQQGMQAGLATLQSELGDNFQSDLTAARMFLRDLETVSPGVFASLERNGAGNDPRLVKAAIREARRRGY